MEYCSTVPVADQVRAAGSVSTPSVMVPVGVLKRQGASVNTSSGILYLNPHVFVSDMSRDSSRISKLPIIKVDFT